MPKAELKTKKTELSVSAFLNTITEQDRRKDVQALVDLMEQVVKAKPKMWGTAIIGFGDRHLVYKSGRELDWFQIGFSPRKQNFALYIPGATEQVALLKKTRKTYSRKRVLVSHGFGRN